MSDELRLAQDRLMHAALAYSWAQRDLEAAEKEWLEAGQALDALAGKDSPKQPKPPRGPPNLKAGGFTNGLWRLQERKEALLTKLRTARDEAAALGDHAEALILNDRINDLKSGATSETVERVMQGFERALAQKRVTHQLCQCPSCRGRGYTNPAFNCRWCEGTGVVSEEDAAAFGPED